MGTYELIEKLREYYPYYEDNTNVLEDLLYEIQKTELEVRRRIKQIEEY